MAQVTITQDNAEQYIKAGKLNPKGKINFGGTRTVNGRTDDDHNNWLYLEDALKQGRKFRFTININDPIQEQNRKVATTTEDFVVETPRIQKETPNKEWYGLKNFEDTFGISLKEAASYLPWIGDGIDIYDSAVDASKGDYSTAGITLAGMLVPNIIEKPLKGLWKWGKNAYLARKLNKSIGIPSTIKLTSKTSQYSPTKEKSGRLIFNERSSKLTEAEIAGDPKIKRNQPNNPSLTNFGELDVLNRENNPNLGNFLGNGVESYAFEKNGRVYKVIMSPFVNLGENLDLNNFYKQYIYSRNKHKGVFEPLKLEGKVKFLNKEYPVASQRKLIPIGNNHFITNEESIKVNNMLEKLMKDNGYKIDNEDSYSLFKDYISKKGRIGDIKYNNMGYTPEGYLRLFDILTDKQGGKLIPRQKHND